MGKLITRNAHIYQRKIIKSGLSEVTPKEGDIVFSYEATLGRYALIPEGFNWMFGQATGCH